MPWTVNVSGISVSIHQQPDVCPHCRFSIEATNRGSGGFIPTDGGQPNRLDMAFRCPRDECKRLFIGEYVQPIAGRSYILTNVLPKPDFAPTVFEETVQKISARFCAIYREAEAAEFHDLNEICGPGFRKALEFLIKDYCCGRQVGEAKRIKEMPLIACIREFVQDPKIRQVAERATWLGNDETHYEKRWEDKDLSDLKSLIRLTLFWIEAEILTDATLESMPGGKH